MVCSDDCQLSKIQITGGRFIHPIPPTVRETFRENLLFDLFGLFGLFGFSGLFGFQRMIAFVDLLLEHEEHD